MRTIRIRPAGWGIVWLTAVMSVCGAARGQTHSLYLNYQGDANFPEFSDEPQTYHTSPLSAFSAAQLGVGLSSNATTLLRQNTLNIVREAFSEFDVLVTDRKPFNGRYQTVGVDHSSGWPLAGLADDVDVSADDQDYARVWGGSLSQLTAFTGSGATVDRWSRGLGYSIAHEAAHNYGADHPDAQPTPGELQAGYFAADHVMATGGDITPEQRATHDRVFSEKSYQILAATLGLRANTLWNWQVVNPNREHAESFHVVFESAHDDLTFAWEYNGDPFLAPTLFHLGEQQGITRYELVWSGGTGVSGGSSFRSGISFHETNDFRIVDSYLSAGGVPLLGKPAMVSYRMIQDQPGYAYLELENSGSQSVEVRNFRLRQIPRMVDLDRMTSDDLEELWTRPLGGGLEASKAERRPITPSQDYEMSAAMELGPNDLEIIDLLNLPATTGGNTRPAATAIDKLSDGLLPMDVSRRDSIRHTRDILFGEMEGTDLTSPLFAPSMLPSVYVYGSANVVLKDQWIWNESLQDFELGELTTELFFQLAGKSTIPTFAAADFNFDGSVDAADAGWMFQMWGQSDPLADLFPDGTVDAADAGVMFEQWTSDVGPLVPEPPLGRFAVACMLATCHGLGRLRKLRPVSDFPPRPTSYNVKV